MPTKRAWVFGLLAIALYLMANQTQVGWIYVMSNGLAGLLLVAFLYSLGGLKSVDVRRACRPLAAPSSEANLPEAPLPTTDEDAPLKPPEFFEDGPVEVILKITNSRLKPAFLISGQEQCPFAPPADQTQPLFVPALFKGRPAQLGYQTVCHRRGLHVFPAVRLRSQGPFGLFARQRSVPTPDELLIYPAYYPLKRLRLLENKGFADRQALRVGAGSEVIGTREYRSGDSLRQIHWRSTARVGKLVVKEFLDNDQLTMAVALDLSTQGNVGQGKYCTFETAVRLAASLGYYATRQNIPFRLFGHSPRWRPPAIALSWWGLLNYLAKTQNDGSDSLATVLSTLPPLPFVVALVSRPDESISRELLSLQRRGSQILALFITPDGALPPSAPPGSEGLEIKAVNAERWQMALMEL